MPHLPRVIRSPQTVLAVYETPTRAVIKLSQRDVLRIEQMAGTSIDFVEQPRLVSIIDRLGILRLTLDDADRAALAGLPNAAPARPPAPASPARPAPAQSSPAAAPLTAGAPPPGAVDDASTGDPSPGLRWGLVAGIAGLAIVLILAVILLARFFGSPADVSPEETPTAEVTTTITATPAAPNVIALSNVSVRSGPDAVYPVIGLLPAGGSADVVGRNDAGTWWLINGPNIQGDQGWVPDDQVTARNTGSVPVATPPPLPTPTATPQQAFSGWKGEYYANPDLQGQPALVRDDPQINFNWGAGAPAPGLPPNDYSIRWTRQPSFDQGDYRFTVNVEGGVRLWLDGRSLIDSWTAQGLRLEQADSGPLSQGSHEVRVEYQKRSGNGQIALSWELIPRQPPTAKIAGPTTGMAGESLRFSAAGSTAPPGGNIVSYEWRFGDGGTGSGVEVVKSYTQPASYEVTLVVTADNGLASVATQQVVIAPAPQPPKAIIDAPAQGAAGQALTFNGGGSTGQTALTGYLWSFGDGVAATGQVVQHAYSQAGVYTVSLTVTDSSGLTGVASQQVSITAAATPTPTPLALEGIDWRWEAALPGAPVTARFQDGVVGGNGGCNGYSGEYVMAGQSLTVGPLSTAGLVCADDVTEAETTYLAALQGARGYEISGARLRIFGVVGDQDVELFFVTP